MQIESAHNPPSNRRRILFFGMHGAFSRAPLAALLAAAFLTMIYLSETVPHEQH